MKKKTDSRIMDKVSITAFVCSLCIIFFTYGILVETFQFFPYKSINRVKTEVIKIFQEGDATLHHLSKARHQFEGVRIHDSNAVSPGVTLLTGFWKDLDWKPGIRLISIEGDVLHQWETDPAEIWPRSPHRDSLAGTKNISQNYVHGSHLFENGDVLFSIEYMGLVRMNAAGQILWTLPYRTHHSVTQDDSGNFWVCGMKSIDKKYWGGVRDSNFPGLILPASEDTAVLVSPEGEVLREISILKALYKSGYKKYIWQNGFTGDVLHVNDVEALPSDMASEYPLFNAGDLLISAREMNAVFVIDTDTEKVKWMSRVFIGQHDPDFIGSGYIRVFDNVTDGTLNGDLFGGSEILKLQPGLSTPTPVFPEVEYRGFYTVLGGKVQELSNGNLLITEARPARAFEVSPDGDVVWEWVAELYDGTHVSEVLEATRYNISPEQVALWMNGGGERSYE